MKYYKLRKTGQTTLALTIPKFVEDNLSLKEGDEFAITLEGNKIIFRKVDVDG